MSDDSISDTGDVNEGEGAKIVQSSFKDPSIVMKSIIKQDSPLKTEESKSKLAEIPQEPLKEFKGKQIEGPAQGTPKAAQDKYLTNSQKRGKMVIDEFCFESPKMQSIPIVNKDTTHPDRFDLDFLLNPQVQKIAKSGHRLTQSSTIIATKSNLSHTNHIKNNIAIAKSHTNSMSVKEISKQISKVESKSSSLDVDERFYSKARKTEEKVKALKQLKEMEEINDCTFHPKIKTKRKAKTCDEYFEYMKTFSDRKQKKITSIQEEEKKSYEKSIDLPHKPKLCEKSLHMVATKASIEETLYNQTKLSKYFAKSDNTNTKHSPISEEKAQQKFFHPSVNKRSKDLQRAEPIEKILYDDALRRLTKQSTPKQVSCTRFITENSEKYLIDKLKREFEEGFYEVDIDSANEINYTRTIELFRIMGMVRNDAKREEERLLLLEAWKILSEEEKEYCSKDSILAFVLAVMGFYEESLSNWDIKSTVLNPKEVAKIHKKFELFYSNRASAASGKSISKAEKEQNKYSFQPQIGVISSRLSESSKTLQRYNGKIEDSLIAEKEKVNRKLDELRLKKEVEVMEECSFNPMIEQMPEEFRIYGNTDKDDLATEYFKLANNPEFEKQHKGIFLHNLSKVYKDKKEVIKSIAKGKEIEKELENCTFAPHLEKRIFPEDDMLEEEHIKKREVAKPVVQKISPVKKHEIKCIKPSKVVKAPARDKKEGAKDIEGFHITSNKNGVVKITIRIGSSTETLDFKLKDDDPTHAVMAFSNKFGLHKDAEYKLVKELTVLKYESE